jgi:predicted alpha/beta hydrolase family esterase
MLIMTQYFIIPGLGNSGEGHWQTWLEQSGVHFSRIWQNEWDAPDCQDWIHTIDQELAGMDLNTVVLIGHSLGCTAIVQWALQYGKKIKGALLVAPSDLEAPVYTFPATGFTPIPLHQLPFKSIVVASTNDPWVSIKRAEQFATAWGSTCINIGDAGHINVSAGYGPWPQALELLKMLD